MRKELIMKSLDAVMKDLIKSEKKKKFYVEILYINVLRNVISNMTENDINRFDNTYIVDAEYYKIT